MQSSTRQGSGHSYPSSFPLTTSTLSCFSLFLFANFIPVYTTHTETTAASARPTTTYTALPILVHTPLELSQCADSTTSPRPAPRATEQMDSYGVKRRDTTKGPPLRVLSLGKSFKYCTSRFMQC